MKNSFEVLLRFQDIMHSKHGSASYESVFAALPGGDTNPQAVRDSVEQAPSAMVSTGDYRHRTVSYRTTNHDFGSRHR